MPRRAITILAAVLLAGCDAGSTATPSLPSPTQAATATPSASAAATPAPSLPASQEPGLRLVAIGDSVPFNSPDDCPGCKGFVDQYGEALEEATGETVLVLNRSEHNGNTIQMLLAALQSQQSRRDVLATADAIIVGIAANDVPMNSADDDCDGPADPPDWSKFTDACLAAEVEAFTPRYEALYALVAELRAGKPTILRTINRYNDWNGWPGHDLSAKDIAASIRVDNAWNEMICGAAEKSGFVCADISTAFNGADGKTPSGDLLVGDYAHPSQKGNDVIARVLIDLGFAPLAP